MRPVLTATAAVAAPLLLAVLALAGCRGGPKGLDPDELLPQGELRVYTIPELRGVADRHARQFMAQYPGTRVTVETRTTRGAIVALLADSGRVVYLDRPLNEEERGVANRRHDTLAVHERPLGYGALVLVRNAANPVAVVPQEQLGAFVRSAAPTWDAFGGSGRMLLGTTGRNTGTYEVLSRRVAPGRTDLVPAFVGQTPQDVMRVVAEQPGALGVVPLSALPDTAAAGVRTLAVSDSGFAFRPSQLNVYEQTYPLHYRLYVYAVGRLGQLPSRFSGFAGDVVGQRAVQDAGLVPETIPVRTVQLN